MNHPFLLYGAAGIVGVGSTFLPSPIEKTGAVLFLVTFLAIIILGHVVALRNNKYGIFAQYIHPIKLFSEKVNKNEKTILFSCIILLAGIIFGFLLRLSV